MSRDDQPYRSPDMAQPSSTSPKRWTIISASALALASTRQHLYGPSRKHLRLFARGVHSRQGHSRCGTADSAQQTWLLATSWRGRYMSATRLMPSGSRSSRWTTSTINGHMPWQCTAHCRQPSRGGSTTRRNHRSSTHCASAQQLTSGNSSRGVSIVRHLSTCSGRRHCPSLQLPAQSQLLEGCHPPEHVDVTTQLVNRHE
jgi:hypothetical protein